MTVPGSERLAAEARDPEPTGVVDRPPVESRPVRRVRRRIRWIAAGVLAVLVAVAIVAATRPSAQATPYQSPLLGHRAPAFSGEALGGGHVSLASYRGRFVVLNFYATWCPPCQQEMPDLVRFDFQQSRRTSGAALVSVVFQDSDANARQFDENWGARWPTIPDPGGRLALDYGVTSPPSTFLIGPSGKVVGAFTGPLTTSQLTAALDRARATGR